MKKLLIIILSLLTISSFGITLIKIRDFPNTNSPVPTYMIIIGTDAATRGTIYDTNLSMTMRQLSVWMATNSDFVSTLLSNTNIPFITPQTNFLTQTYSPNFVWTNTVGWWNTNASFNSSNTYNPNPVFSSRLMVSNSAVSPITNFFPFTAYSLSLGANVTKATIPAGSVLDLQVDYYSGIYYIKDYGKNNSTLVQLATNGISGTLHVTNGVLYIY